MQGTLVRRQAASALQARETGCKLTGRTDPSILNCGEASGAAPIIRRSRPAPDASDSTSHLKSRMCIRIVASARLCNEPCEPCEPYARPPRTISARPERREKGATSLSEYPLGVGARISIVRICLGCPAKPSSELVPFAGLGSHETPDMHLAGNASDLTKHPGALAPARALVSLAPLPPSRLIPQT
ncbi:hypothetical protein GQ53DRAFT_397443 [Thozetella sp. PMI_491]|nr:hypothetical protein GQ53DRAFT_397443 [Thozetella sp. PMI_491]